MAAFRCPCPPTSVSAFQTGFWFWIQVSTSSFIASLKINFGQIFVQYSQVVFGDSETPIMIHQDKKYTFIFLQDLIFIFKQVAYSAFWICSLNITTIHCIYIDVKNEMTLLLIFDEIFYALFVTNISYKLYVLKECMYCINSKMTFVLCKINTTCQFKNWCAKRNMLISCLCLAKDNKMWSK